MRGGDNMTIELYMAMIATLNCIVDIIALIRK